MEASRHIYNKMITNMFAVVLLLMVYIVSHGDTKEVTCKRDFRKIGCFKRDLKKVTDLLITDLDPTHKNYTQDMNWNDFSAGLHSLACRCRKKAVGHYKYFAIGFHAECVSGKDYPAIEEMFAKQSVKDAEGCINGKRNTCDKKQKAECAGVEDYDFFYEILQGSTCTFRFTPFNVDGGGNMVYLDRHHLSCGSSGGLLSMFHLQRLSRTYVRYQYKCCSLQSYIGTCKMQGKSTRLDVDGGGKTYYLDRHIANCGNGFITGFRIVRSSKHGKVQYRYNCCNLSRSTPSCYWGYTAYTYDGKGNLVYLDRQTVKCKDDHALSYFRLVRNNRNGKYIRYIYRCCKNK